ncbi:MAG TPA: hypothetical protein VMN78_05060 [Longimicrobiales bacterium]|nr:hypothetical protein [Longimicrobiales bacterium]
MRTLQSVLALGFVLLSANACTRRVQVESEPSRYEASAQPAASIDVVGLYDYVVPLDGGDAVGTMTVTRASDSYAVAFTTNIGDVTTRNVRRNGNTLTMDISTPNGEGALEITWQSRDRATGSVFLGEALRMNIVRRS